MTDQQNAAQGYSDSNGKDWVSGDGSMNCPPEFPIKGNRSSKLAHAPGSRYFASTEPEICFADEAAVVAQGFRMAGRAAAPASRMDADSEALQAPSGNFAAVEAEPILVVDEASVISSSSDAMDLSGGVETGEVAAAAESAPEAKSYPAPVLGPKRYAIIKTGGKQYRVSVGDRIVVERLHDDDGTEITIDQVLLVGGVGAIQVGAPTVDGATVTARVDNHYRGEKIVVFKYKPKKRYRRRIGHRQSLTHITITGINA